MRKHKGSEPSRSASEGYLLPEGVHLTLVQTSGHLHLLARLTAPRSLHDDLPQAELSLKPVALAHCFRELADRLDHTLRQVRWPADPPAA